ncbi:MAG: isoprenylcysteine carboxylmethyltransferase family protein [Anaerolineales bacterium]|jgi:protein-S-isoprenylcysteine O-methyltransferase Ste14
MNASTTNHENHGIPWRGLISLLILIALMPCVLFLCAGRLDWWEGWAYTANALIVLVSSRALVLIKSPDMARERSEAGSKEDVKPWDRVLMPLTALVGPFVSWIIAGLDERFGWTPDLPDGIQIAALLVIFLGSNIGTWAMLSNRFFSSQVRIQHDRGQTVVSTGPYRFVRHPGYAGGVLSWLAAPVFFSSYWLVIPTVIVIALTVVRTALEDRTLLEELPGYREYAQKVRYRLLPGIW